MSSSIGLLEAEDGTRQRTPNSSSESDDPTKRVSSNEEENSGSSDQAITGSDAAPSSDATQSIRRANPFPDNTNIFVSGLPLDMLDIGLYNIFHEFGDICSFEVVREPQTGRSRGIGFVRFVQGVDTGPAIRHTNGKTITLPDAPSVTFTLRVRKATIDSSRTSHDYKTCKLFVRHVPPSLSQDELVAYFSTYGTVIECTIQPDVSRRGKVENTGLNMAYVTFNSPEEALAAVSVEHSQLPLSAEEMIRNGPLVVKLAETLERRNERFMTGKVHRHMFRSGAAPTTSPVALPTPPPSSNFMVGGSPGPGPFVVPNSSMAQPSQVLPTVYRSDAMERTPAPMIYGPTVNPYPTLGNAMHVVNYLNVPSTLPPPNFVFPGCGSPIAYVPPMANMMSSLVQPPPPQLAVPPLCHIPPTPWVTVPPTPPTHIAPPFVVPQFLNTTHIKH